jgi:hypothetical protein
MSAHASTNGVAVAEHVAGAIVVDAFDGDELPDVTIDRDKVEAHAAIDQGDWPAVSAIAKAKAEATTRGAEVPPWSSAILAPGDWPEDEPQVKWLARTLRLAPGRPALFNGPGGIGKTFVAMWVAACLGAGVAGLDGLVESGAPRRAIHLDADQGATTTRRRYRRLLAGLGVDTAARPHIVGLSEAKAAGFDPTSSADWSRILAGFDFAIVDSLSAILAMCDLDENASSDVRKVLTPLLAASEATGCAVLVITHTGQDDAKQPGKAKRPRGSSGIMQAAGAIWSFAGDPARGSTRTVTLERESESDDGGELVTAWNYTIGVAAEATPGLRTSEGEPVPALVVKRGDIQAPTPEQDRDAALMRRIQDALRTQHQHSNADVLLRAANAGRLQDGRRVLARMQGDGVVVKHDRCFRLKSDVRDEPRHSAEAGTPRRGQR